VVDRPDPPGPGAYLEAAAAAAAVRSLRVVTSS
jgi:hypothetical protein